MVKLLFANMRAKLRSPGGERLRDLETERPIDSVQCPAIIDQALHDSLLSAKGQRMRVHSLKVYKSQVTQIRLRCEIGDKGYCRPS